MCMMMNFLPYIVHLNILLERAYDLQKFELLCFMSYQVLILLFLAAFIVYTIVP